MLRSMIVAMAVGGALVPYLPAQVPLTHLQLSKHIAIDVPGDWTVASEFAPDQRAITDTLLLHSKDSALQSDLRNGIPQTLLVAHNAAGTLSLNLNIESLPRATFTTFAAFGPSDLVARTASMCRTLSEVFGRLQAIVDSCGPIVRDSAAGRVFVVLPYGYHMQSGAYVNWGVQYTIPDAIVSLTLIAPANGADAAKGEMMRIWHSVRLQ